MLRLTTVQCPVVEEITQYGTAIETADDLAKDPPLLPPQLQISLMNAPMDASEFRCALHLLD